LSAHYGDLGGKRVALWGLAFKPNTDDMREAPSRVFMEACWAAGVTVQAYDPVASDEARRLYGERDDLKLCATPEAALEGADALVVATEWREFRSPDFDAIKASLSEPVVIDGRNIYDPEHMTARGFAYYAIGRGA
jgi:UDPglucose 6-dehydrogenase